MLWGANTRMHESQPGCHDRQMAAFAKFANPQTAQKPGALSNGLAAIAAPTLPGYGELQSPLNAVPERSARLGMCRIHGVLSAVWQLQRPAG